MPTLPRPDRLPPRPSAGFDRCDCCGTLYAVKERGRTRLYCSDNCRKLAYLLGQLGRALDEIPDDAPKEGLSQIRRQLWVMANQLNRLGRP
jgi:endogenous inhibitor of DNA gyrase (YacG/DUF329 family)